MGKLDELMRSSRSIAAESMGMVRVASAAAMPGASPAPTSAAPATPARLQGITRSKDTAVIPVERIGPDPDQPREEFDEEALRHLAESLKARGQLQPIRVRWDEAAGRYIIICGERRWRAAMLAGLPSLSCVILDGPLEPAELLAVQLVENLLREDLRPIEQAKAFRALMDANGWSTHQLARELAVTQSNVVRALALLDLPADVQEQVEQGALPPATAYEISKLADPDARGIVAARAVAENLTRAEVVEVVRRRSGGPSRPGKGRGKARKVTARVLRTAGGHKITVEHRRGVDDDSILAALEDAVGQIRATLEGRGDAADAA